jgi:hypothetical protein
MNLGWMSQTNVVFAGNEKGAYAASVIVGYRM